MTLREFQSRFTLAEIEEIAAVSRIKEREREDQQRQQRVAAQAQRNRKGQ